SVDFAPAAADSRSTERHDAAKNRESLMFHTKAAIAAAILAATALPAAAQEEKLSLINFLQNEQAFGQPAVEWTEMVNKAGKGGAQVEIKPYTAMPGVETGKRG